MDRLTRRRKDGSVIIAWKCPEDCGYRTYSIEEGYCCQHECEKELFEKLATYEDLEEQGLLVKLPCKVGDTVYIKMQFGGYAKGEVRDFTYFVTCGFCVVVTSDKFDKINIPFSEFGKSIFLKELRE